MFAQPQIVSVTQVADFVRLLVESDPFLANIWVEGEVTGTFLSRAGHLYFSLTDGESSVKAVAFRNTSARVQHVIENGAQVVVGGRVSVYNRDSAIQIYIDFAEPSGQGVQALQLARLRNQLESEGLFDPLRKRPIPAFPTRIAVVTSPGGAVIHDIQTVLRRRFPLATLIVSPAQVQGAGSVDSILTALDLVLAEAHAELVIIARGGGSAEDLSAFNDERLARAVFASPIPVVSAIGHETDFSILDQVADLRAPTPTAAAELISPDIAELALEIIDARDILSRTLIQRIRMTRIELDHASQRLDRSNPVAVLTRHRERLQLDRSRMNVSALTNVRTGHHELQVVRIRLRAAGIRIIDRQHDDIRHLTRELKSRAIGQVLSRRSLMDVARARIEEMNPTLLLRRGFSVLTRADGSLVDSIDTVQSGDRIRATMRDGTISADVVGTSKRIGSPGR